MQKYWINAADISLPVNELISCGTLGLTTMSGVKLLLSRLADLPFDCIQTKEDAAIVAEKLRMCAIYLPKDEVEAVRWKFASSSRMKWARL